MQAAERRSPTQVLTQRLAAGTGHLPHTERCRLKRKYCNRKKKKQVLDFGEYGEHGLHTLECKKVFSNCFLSVCL